MGDWIMVLMTVGAGAAVIASRRRIATQCLDSQRRILGREFAKPDPETAGVVVLLVGAALIIMGAMLALSLLGKG